MWDRETTIWVIVLTVVAVGQIVAAVVFYNCADNAALTNLGWAVMALSGVFGWLPIFTFRLRGGVEKGESYVKTTELVDTGIYGIVRHPQYLAGIILSLSLALIAPHWIVIGLGIIASAIYVLNTFQEERSSIEKFGDAYREYKKRVPRLNFVLGIVRALRRRATRDAREEEQRS